MATLGVQVLSLRGMKHLAECLESVKWADAVTVLHAGEGEPLIGMNPFSSLTLRKFVSTQEWDGLAREVRTDWVLHLWGEERLEGELQEELRALCRKELPQAPMAYRVPVRSHLLGRWVEGSLLGPSPALRLSRRVDEIPFGWWNVTESKVRESPTLPRGWISDWTATALKDGVDLIQGVSELWAERLRTKGQEPGPISMVLGPFQVFLRMLFNNGIFSHGFAGLTLSTLAAYATLLTGAKVWEARNVREREKVGDKVP